MGFNLAWGFAVWLAATLLARSFGQYVFVPSPSPVLLVGLFLAAAPLLMATVTFPVYRWRGLQTRSERMAATFAMWVPTVALDAFTTLFFPVLFPNMAPDAVRLWGALLFWAYTLALLTGLTGITGASGKRRSA